MLQKTSDRVEIQARYALRHPGTGTDECAAAADYRQRIRLNYQRETHTPASLAEHIAGIQKAMVIASGPLEEKVWYQQL